MSNLLIRAVVRSLFTFTSRNRALKQSEELCKQYSELANGLSVEEGSYRFKVPPMRGVDEDMREWSFFMLLEHNTIVNRSITATVTQLARGEPLSGLARIDPKKDVMPTCSADETQLSAFQESVQHHISTVKKLGRLRGTETSAHPIFGEFDAHKWNCMFSFHLRLHYPQAQLVVQSAKAALAD